MGAAAAACVVVDEGESDVSGWGTTGGVKLPIIETAPRGPTLALPQAVF
jgi:hypothetical protein